MPEKVYIVSAHGLLQGYPVGGTYNIVKVFDSRTTLADVYHWAASHKWEPEDCFSISVRLEDD